jgi:Bacterial Ig-like domain/WD40-like Beta Propeller Repeat
MSPQQRWTHRTAALALAATIALWACEAVQEPEASAPRPVLTAAVVSNPAAVSSGAGAAFGGNTSEAMVYLSLPPGSVPGAEQVTIRNPRTGALRTVTMVEGGFDPVAMEASAGDTLDLDIQVAGAEAPLLFSIVVPDSRPPVVVRTDPPPKKRDVPLNAVLLVVFSEPINAATLTDASVQLLLGGVPVAGTLAFGDDAHLTVTFTPTEPLAGGAEYTLLVTQAIKDLDGDTLEAPVTVGFETDVPRLGSLAVVTTVSGAEAQAGGYRLDLDGAAGPSIGLNDTVIVADLREGPHVVWLRGLPGDCAVAGPNPQTVAVAFGDTTAATFAVTCGQATQLVFVRDGQIHLVNSDGTGVVRLSDGPGDGDPAWSPDGQRIAFARTRGDTTDIYVMDADGSNVARRTDASAYNGEPTWSPDGRAIAFTSIRDGSADVCIVSADGEGSSAVCLTGSPGYDAQPAWSPDGDKIVFVSDRRGYAIYDLWVANADGSGVSWLAESGAGYWDYDEFYFTQPAWSPDGGRIAINVCAYPFGDCFPNSTIAVMNADRSGFTPLAAAGGYAKPTWSPDGRTIAFSSSACRGCATSIRYVRADGSQEGVIVANGYSPSWRR